MAQAVCKENAHRCMDILGESSENCYGLYIFLEMNRIWCDHLIIMSNGSHDRFHNHMIINIHTFCAKLFVAQVNPEVCRG
jgi:hypothetical protein